MKMFGSLQELYETTGTTRAPTDKALRTWVTTQRGNYRKGKLSAERIKLLESIGDWSWDARN